MGEVALLIDGPCGPLEARYQGLPEARGLALLCHPHPLFAGTMQNKVVTTLARTFDQLGLSTVRFNYRGVGKSEGTYGHISGEIQDLLAVLHWTSEQLPGADYWLAGFSFGTYISASGAIHWPTQQLVSIAPTIDRHDFGVLAPHIHCPWLVVQGDQDEIISAPLVFEWARHAPVEIITLAGAGHFFHGRLVELREKLLEKLR